MAGGLGVKQPYEGGYGMNPINPPQNPYQGPPTTGSGPQSLDDYARQMLARWRLNGMFNQGGAQQFRQAFMQGGDPSMYLAAHPKFALNHPLFTTALNTRYGIQAQPPTTSSAQPAQQAQRPEPPPNPAADSLKQLGSTVNRLIKAHAGTFGYAGAV